jgi:hypothetical protein
MADLHRYRSLIGRWPMFWDNTLYARSIDTNSYGGYTTHYPEKVRMCNLFEPYDTYRPEKFHQYNDGRQMYINGEAFSEIYLIKYATVADYTWNTTAYNPELSLWKVLCAAYGGPAAAEELLLFNDAFYGLYSVCLWATTAGVKPKHVKAGRKYLAKMANGLNRLSESPSTRGRLLQELKSLMIKQKNRFDKILADDHP